MNRRQKLITAVVMIPILLGGCIDKGARDRLSRCLPVDASLSESAADGSRTLRLQLHNTADRRAILDSARLEILLGDVPLGIVTHGRTVELPPHDTTEVVLSLHADPGGLALVGVRLLLSPPDSVRMRGIARVPMMGGLWHSDRTVRHSMPFSRLRPLLGSLIGSGWNNPTP